MPAYRGSLKVSRGAGLAMGMLAAAAGGVLPAAVGDVLSAATIDGEPSTTVRKVLFAAAVSSGELSAPVSGTLLTAAVNNALSSVSGGSLSLLVTHLCRKIFAETLKNNFNLVDFLR